MEAIISRDEKNNRTKGMVTSIILHILFLVLLALPFMKYTVPPPGQRGILVSLGTPDTGQGQDKPDTRQEEVVPPRPKSAPEQKKQEEEVTKKVVRTSSKPKEVITTETPEEIAIRKQKEEEAERRAEERKRQQEIAEAKRRAEEDAKRKAEEEARKKAELKKGYSALFKGSGEGQTGQPGSQGDPDGDPDATRLDGISKGSDMVGGGLGDRGVMFEPEIRDDSQKTGTVVVKVCVNQDGDVISARYTQRGSTTTDSELRSKAERSARQFKFTPSDIPKQCGTITIVYKLQ